MFGRCGFHHGRTSTFSSVGGTSTVWCIQPYHAGGMVEAYDTVHNTWHILPSMPHQRHGLAVGVVDKRLYAVSGDGQSAGNGIAESDVNYNEALKLDEVLK